MFAHFFDVDEEALNFLDRLLLKILLLYYK